MNNWSDLIEMTGGQEFSVERVHLKEKGVSIEGSFELPELFKLSEEDQFFVMAFVKSHGNIKAMERYFGVSYPTIKSRLAAISDRLKMVDIQKTDLSRKEILEKIESGEMGIEEATKLLEETF